LSERHSRWAARPNIVLILADDMGFSDPGCFGSEIKTPSLDTLAAHGVRFTQFYNGARCCPTRAALLTGLYAHQAGQGNMTTDQSATEGDGYTGGLNRRCVTIAEVLKTAGYATYMSGKWHVVVNADKPGSDQNGWPRQRGFDRYFGPIHGGANYFTGINNNGNKLVSGNDTIDTPANFYMTDNLGDTAAKYIAEHFVNSPDRPFFLYAAFTAPHWPLHALKADIDKYRTRYTAGWEALRAERYSRQVQMGLIQSSWPLSPEDAPAWSSLSQAMKDTMALKMAIYAAQVDRLDQNIGKIVAQLKASHAFDNTLIVFLSDNGACAEGGDFGWGPNSQLETKLGWNISYGQGWAHVSNTPFSLYKHYTREGGISAPFVVHWPARISNGGRLVNQIGHITDLMPTFIEVAGATYPKAYNGYLITPLEGKSLVKAFTNADIGRTAPIFWEHEGNKAVRDGKWKLLSNQGNPWRLFDMEADRTELADLAGANAARVSSMGAAWDAWARRAYVLKEPTTVPTYLRLVSPNGGEVWKADSQQQITWGASTDTVQYLKAFYAVDGGEWIQIVDTTRQAGGYLWTVPHVASTNVVMRLVSRNGMWADTCDAPFSIIVPDDVAPRTALTCSRVTWRYERDGICFVNLTARADIRIYDMAGSCVAQVPVSAGTARWSWNDSASPLSRTGVYVVRLRDGRGELRFTVLRMR
jgi:arylsulfatase